MSISTHNTKNTRIVRRGPAIPTYFLGRPRETYVAVYASRQTDPVYARAA